MPMYQERGESQDSAPGPPRPARGVKSGGLSRFSAGSSGGDLLANRGGNAGGDGRDSASTRSSHAGSTQAAKSWDRPASARSSDIEGLLTRQGSQIAQLDLSACSLTSLAHYRSAMASLQRLRHLDISQNLITTLRPVRDLPALETINCSNNNIKLLDGLADCPQISSIIAADNMIAGLGDLCALSKLRTLGLRGNALTSVAVLPHHLPAGLHSLDVANNELGNLSELRYVSSLMDLRNLDVRANPLTSMAHMKNINYRPFIVFLLPRLALLDSSAITRDEWTASRCLFSSEPGVLSESLMTLLQPVNEKQLRQYLTEKCPATLPEGGLITEGDGGGYVSPHERERERERLPMERKRDGAGRGRSREAQVRDESGDRGRSGVDELVERGAVHDSTGSHGKELANGDGSGDHLAVQPAREQERHRDRARDRSVPAGAPAWKQPPFLLAGALDGDGGARDEVGGGDVDEHNIDVATLSKHVKEMRKYFKAYIKSQNKRRLVAAETLQRALRTHWARRIVLVLCHPDSFGRGDGAGWQGSRESSYRESQEALGDVHTVDVFGGGVGGHGRMSIRQVCAVRIQGVARGMLVR